MMAWGAPIWIYLWLAGMAGGAYFAAFLAERFAGETNRHLLRLAAYLGIPLAVIGVILLVVDLGSPLRFWHLFAQFDVMSPMSLGTWILLVWVGIAVIMVILWWAERRLPQLATTNIRQMTELLGWIDLIFAVLLIAYTGVLLAVSSRSLWAGSVLLPSLFVASAISTGVAMLIIAALVANAIARGGLVELRLAINQFFGSTDWTIPNRTVGRLAEADAVVILVELVVLIGYAIWLSASTMAGAGDALRLLTTGILAAPFWVGVVFLALLIPLWLDLANWGKDMETRVAWGPIVLPPVSLICVASAACVILGGLILRAIMVIGGQL